MDAKPKRCKDCGSTTRPATFPGPRCYTDHQKRRRDLKKKAAEAREAKLYGLRPGDYEEVLARQNGVCAICERAKGVAKRLAKDHRHSDGLFRGLLCSPCNWSLANARDKPEFFLRAIAYLENPPAAYLGRYAPVEK